jgi:hypothetical protein
MHKSRWAVRVKKNGEKRVSYRVQVEKVMGMVSLGRYRRGWEDIIKMDCTGFFWLRIGTRRR